jgi:hypothetical protein
MKKILLVLSLFIATATFSQDSSKTPVLDKTEQLVDKYGGKIADAFMNTMESAKPLAKEGFKSVVFLQIAKGVGGMIPAIIFIIAFSMFYSEYDKIDAVLKSDNVPNHMDSGYGPFGEDNINPKLILTLIASCIFLIVSCFTVYDGLLHLISPKWFAIKEIIELFK